MSDFLTVIRKGTGNPPNLGDTTSVLYNISIDNDGEMKFIDGNTQPTNWIVGEDVSDYLSSILLKMQVGSSVTFGCSVGEVFGALGLPGHSLEPATNLLVSLELLGITAPPAGPSPDLDQLKLKATAIKEEGNKHIATNPALSKGNYLEAVSLFESLPSTKEVQAFLGPFYTNISQCDISTLDLSSALYYAHCALQMDPNNPKALYRCGQVLELCKKWNASLYYFEKSHKTAPSQDILRKIQNTRAEKDKEKKGKALWAGIFAAPDAPEKIE